MKNIATAFQTLECYVFLSVSLFQKLLSMSFKYVQLYKGQEKTMHSVVSAAGSC